MNSTQVQLFQSATRFLIALPSVLSTAFLVACGGGSGQGGAPEPSVPLPLGAAGSCNPTLEQFKAIAQPVFSVLEVNKAIGCEGVLETALDNYKRSCTSRFCSENTDLTYSTTEYTYRWASRNGGPEVLFIASKDKSVTSFSLPGRVRFETKQLRKQCTFDPLNIPLLHAGQSVKELNATLGCEGFTDFYDLTESGLTSAKIYWGTPKEVYVELTGEKATSGYSPQSLTTCIPNISNWEKLAIGDSASNVQLKMQCDGNVAYSFDNQSNTGKFDLLWGGIEWGSLAQGYASYTATATFDNGVLSEKNFSPPIPADYCLVRQQVVETISIGMTRANIDAIMGCSARKFEYSSSDNRYVKLSAQWGNPLFLNDQGLLTVNFINDVLVSRDFVTGAFAVTKCPPSQIKFDSLLVGDNYTTAVQKIGCEGVLVKSTSLQAGTTDSTYAWQIYPEKLQGYGQLIFRNGLLVGKSFQAPL
jgi:hypothetical protein